MGDEKMKKKILFLLLIVALGAMTVSCFKKKEKDKDKPTTEQQTNTNGTINTDMFNAGTQPVGNPNIKNLTPEEQKFLIDNQIDPAKVSPAIDKALLGDKEAILSLAQLYFNLKDNEKTKKYLQMGVNKNSFSFVTLDQPVAFPDGQEVDILIGLAAVNADVHNGEAIPQIVMLFEDEDVFEKIRAAEVPEDIYKIISDTVAG